MIGAIFTVIGPISSAIETIFFVIGNDLGQNGK